MGDGAAGFEQDVAVGTTCAGVQIGIHVDGVGIHRDGALDAGQTTHRHRVGSSGANRFFTNRQPCHTRRNRKVCDGPRHRRTEAIAVRLYRDLACGVQLQALARRQAQTVIGDGDVAGRAGHIAQCLEANRCDCRVGLQCACTKTRDVDGAAGRQNTSAG